MTGRWSGDEQIQLGRMIEANDNDEIQRNDDKGSPSSPSDLAASESGFVWLWDSKLT